MTPQERDLVTALFERLSALENNPRDPEAERLMSDGVARAPHALYPLVQTVLLQDEALKRANARIEELEGKGTEEPTGSFLDSMRNVFQGRPAAGRGSVPSVRPGSVWNSGQNSGQVDRGVAPAAPMQAQPMPMQQPMSGMAGGGGSFLGTAAAAAVGMIGGSLLFNGIRGLMGGGHPAAFGDYAAGATGSPWGGNASGSELAREAGAGDIGRADTGRDDYGSAGDTTQSAGLYDPAADDSADDGDDFASSDFGDDGSDVA
jgi:hypothetical protein